MAQLNRTCMLLDKVEAHFALDARQHELIAELRAPLPPVAPRRAGARGARNGTAAHRSRRAPCDAVEGPGQPS